VTVPWQAIALVVVASASFGSGVLVTHWKQGNDAFHELERENEQRALVDGVVAAVTKSTVEAIGEIQIENRNVYQRTRTEIVREPVYTECLVPAVGSSLLNEARSPSGSAGSAAARVPTDATNPGE